MKYFRVAILCLALLAPGLALGAPRRVIVDTDPGVDDAIALLFALRSPELQVEAVTAVAGNVPLELTLPNALRMVEIAGRKDVPVARGAAAPLARKLVTAAYAHGDNGLGGLIFPDPTIRPVAEPAPEIIQRIVRKHPGEVSIIAIGPLTNVALALKADPQLASLIQEVVIMGGSLSGGNVTPAAEFNLYVDPEAARMVFQSGVRLTMVGLDVTRKTPVTEEHVKMLEAANNKSAQTAARILRNGLSRARARGLTGGPVMHDSLAVAVFLDKSLVKLRDFYVDVETSGELTAGETVSYSRAPIRRSPPSVAEPPSSYVLSDTYQPNCSVAVDVDVERFFKVLIGRLTAP